MRRASNGTAWRLIAAGVAAAWMLGAWAMEFELALAPEFEPAEPLPPGVSASVEPGAGERGEPAIRITHEGAGAVSVTLFAVEQPAIEGKTLWYEAALRADTVEGKAYLEMWCVVDGQRYFSRGLNQPVMRTQNWPAAKTPFHLEPGQEPERVLLGVRFEGPGSVLLSAPRLYTQGSGLVRVPQPMLIGLISLGVLGGVIGAAFGATAGVLAPKGQGRPLVMALAWALVAWAVLVFACGLWLFTQAVPFFLPWLFLAIGAVDFPTALVFVTLARRRYAEAETRRMMALDL